MPRTRSSVLSPEMPAVSAMLGSRIRTARRDAGMSQARLAELLNTTQSAISLYEAGQRSVGIDMLLAVARILNRPLQYFIGEDGETILVRGGKIGEMIEALERHPEDIPDLLAYWEFLQYRRNKHRNGNGNGHGHL